MCWLKLGLAWGCAWTSLGFLPPLSREEVGKKGTGSGFHFAITTAPTTPPQHLCWCRQTRRECAGFCCPAYPVNRKDFPCAVFECLDFGFSIHGWGALIALLLSQKSHWEDWLLGEFPGAIQKWPIRTSFWDQVCGKGCPSTGHIETPFLVSWCRGYLKLTGKHILSQRFLLQPLDCLSLFLKLQIVLGIWCSWEMKPDTRECERGREMAKGRSKAIFSFSHSW